MKVCRILIHTRFSLIFTLHPFIRSVQHLRRRGTEALIVELLFKDLTVKKKWQTLTGWNSLPSLSI